MKRCTLIAMVTALVFVLVIATGCQKTAKFELSSLEITPSEVTSTDPVTITVDVANVGTAEGTYSVLLIIDGTTQDTERVIVPAGETQKVTFTVVMSQLRSQEQIGVYPVAIGHLRGKIQVVKPAE